MSTTPHPRSSLRRTACDRCRHSKLRCLRDENQQKCTRCLRLELRCEVAPAKPPGRPRKSTSATHATPSEPAEYSATPSAQTQEDGSQSSLRIESSVLPSQSSEDLLSPFDEHQQQDGSLFHHQPAPSHASINGFNLAHLTSLTSMPLSESRTPEWQETTRFDGGLAPNRDPLEVHSLFTAKLDRHECLKELSHLNVDLNSQWQTLQELRDDGKVSFVTFIDHPPPPAGDGVSLAEKLLVMSQRFQQAITNLIWVMRNEARPVSGVTSILTEDEHTHGPLCNIAMPLPTPRSQGADSNQASPEDIVTEQDGALETPFVCALVSCYVQIINLWEIMFVHVQRRISNIDHDPLTLSDPSKGVQMGVFYIYGGRLQSMFFCQAVLYFLDNIDRGLGLIPEQRELGASGLLSHSRHFDLLQKELGGPMSKGENERVRTLKDLVEKVRVFSLHDVGW
ncbi:hypothetical protein F5Y04DRAFT_219384 [Hypomontagnella monticulosa]|nr:hypothetical protein F5Y04DRAFT_219384 [Hypomontagnella monticulosa]